MTETFPPDQLPLKGIRILELGGWWSAAAGGTILGALGADLIKIEPPSMDPWRLTAVPDPSRENSWERSPMFNTFNLNKRGMVLDLGTAAGRDAFLRLVDTADVVLDNYSPRVMPNLGLAYEDLRQRNPRIITASISGYGSTGPWRNYVAHGLGFEQSSGLSSMNGYEDDGLPRGINAYSDAIVGQWTALAIVAALEYRRRTGEGQRIDMAAFEGLTTFLGGALAAYQRRGVIPQRTGNHNASICPHNLYRCAGEDSWVAMTAATPEQWESLCTIIGKPEWANAPSFSQPMDRKARETEIDAAIAEWTINQDHIEVMRRLQEVGVPSAAVLAPTEQENDSGFVATDHFASVRREVIGEIKYPHLPVRYDGKVVPHALPAPLFGEHTIEVLRELGLSESDINDLLAKDVIRSVPRGYG